MKYGCFSSPKNKSPCLVSLHSLEVLVSLFPISKLFFFSSKIIFNFLEYIKSLTGTTLHLTNNIAVVWWSSTTLTLTAVIILVDLAEHVNRSSGARRAGKNAVFKFFLNKNLWRQIVTWKVSVIPIYFSSFLFFPSCSKLSLCKLFHRLIESDTFICAEYEVKRLAQPERQEKDGDVRVLLWVQVYICRANLCRLQGKKKNHRWSTFLYEWHVDRIDEMWHHIQMLKEKMNIY